jgi:hypothetical protein
VEECVISVLDVEVVADFVLGLVGTSLLRVGFFSICFWFLESGEMRLAWGVVILIDASDVRTSVLEMVLDLDGRFGGWRYVS